MQLQATTVSASAAPCRYRKGNVVGAVVERQESRVTRLTRAVCVVTSQIFRCPGLQHISRDADKLGGHDVALWLIFLSVLAAWFLFLFVPQRERLGMLEDRCEMLNGHMKAEKRELARLQRSIKDLQHGDPAAWERAARGRLGWVEPGEVTDLAKGMPPRPVNAENNASKSVPPPPPSVLPRPPIPALPVPPAALRPQDLVLRDPANSDAIGPSRGTPPTPPPLRLAKAPLVVPAARSQSSAARAPRSSAPAPAPAPSGLRLAFDRGLTSDK